MYEADQQRYGGISVFRGVFRKGWISNYALEHFRGRNQRLYGFQRQLNRYLDLGLCCYSLPGYRGTRPGWCFSHD